MSHGCGTLGDSCAARHAGHGIAHCLGAHIERSHGLQQALGLRIHRVGGCARLLNQCRILLRHLIQIAHRLIHLGKAIALLTRSGRDLANQIGDAAHTGHNFLHAGTRLPHLGRACFHIAHAGFNQSLDFFGCFRAALRQGAHFTGHHGKTTALLPGTRRFHRSVQGQDVGLECDAVDHTDDVADLAARAMDLRHAVHHLVHHITATLCGLHRGRGQLGRLARGICRLVHGGSQLFNAGGRFFQVGRRLFGACRQVLIATGNF